MDVLCFSAVHNVLIRTEYYIRSSVQLIYATQNISISKLAVRVRWRLVRMKNLCFFLFVNGGALVITIKRSDTWYCT